MIRTAKKYAKRFGKAGLCLLMISLLAGTAAVSAEEAPYYEDEGGLLIIEEEGETASALEQEEEAAEPDAVLTGTYTVPEGWIADESAGSEEIVVYRAEDAGESTISCSYLDTNYSVSEYEQLRDMLTNSLRYSNVDAQISTSAVYTLNKDYLYIVLVDDSASGYRDIYHYVVGNYRCFCVQVKEYRDEAQEAEAREKKTPQQAGQAMAESFVWTAG